MTSPERALLVGAHIPAIGPPQRRPQTIRVVHVHHHLLHQALPTAQPGWDGTEVTQVTGTGMYPVTATTRKVIAPAALSPGDLGHQLGRLGDRIKRR